jgi:hypothetical protein
LAAGLVAALAATGFFAGAAALAAVVFLAGAAAFLAAGFFAAVAMFSSPSSGMGKNSLQDLNPSDPELGQANYSSAQTNVVCANEFGTS